MTGTPAANQAGLGRDRRSSPGLSLLVLLALVLRLAMPGMLLPDGTVGLVQASADVPICHSGAAADASGNQDPSGGHPVPAHDCALCPACHLAAVPMLLPVAAHTPALQPAGRAAIALRPPSIGPPLHARYAARPRGPPVLLV